MTPRESFISICIVLANIDDSVADEEKVVLNQVFEKFGFSREEVDQVEEKFRNVGKKEAFEFGVQAMMGACMLDQEMRKNLLEAMQQIADADGTLDPEENHMMQVAHRMFGFIGDTRMTLD